MAQKQPHHCLLGSALFADRQLNVQAVQQPLPGSVMQLTMLVHSTLATPVQVAVAQQIYDYVDQRIRRLDKDLKAFDAELIKERARQGLVGPLCITSSLRMPQQDSMHCCFSLRCLSRHAGFAQTCMV